MWRNKYINIYREKKNEYRCECNGLSNTVHCHAYVKCIYNLHVLFLIHHLGYRVSFLCRLISKATFTVISSRTGSPGLWNCVALWNPVCFLKSPTETALSKFRHTLLFRRDLCHHFPVTILTEVDETLLPPWGCYLVSTLCSLVCPAWLSLTYWLYFIKVNYWECTESISVQLCQALAWDTTRDGNGFKAQCLIKPCSP